jgi:urease accessory protein
MSMHRNTRTHVALLSFLAAASLPQAALAHPGVHGVGFAAGFAHPLTGADHILAMLAIGVWAGRFGMPAIWALPVGFLLTMALGGALAIAGVALPAGELGIALSVVALGALIARDRRLAVSIAMPVAAAFALFHGHAHAVALPEHANPLAYGAGVAIASGVLHLAGIRIGRATAAPGRLLLLRAGGAAIALAGVYVSLQVLSLV